MIGKVLLIHIYFLLSDISILAGSDKAMALKRKNDENDLGEQPNKKSRASEEMEEVGGNSKSVGDETVVVDTTEVVGGAHVGSTAECADGDVIDGRKETSDEKEKDNNRKKDAHSTLNRRINNALQTTKAKVEEFQPKYGGEPDFLLVMRDNMTETNDTGRATRINRKIVVSGAGSIFEEFMFKDLKFDPKEMIVVKKGKTLQTDYNMLEQWLEKKALSIRSPNVDHAASSSVSPGPWLPSGTSPPLHPSHVQLQYPTMYPPAMYPPAMYPPSMFPPGFVHPQFFQQAGNMQHPNDSVMCANQDTPTFATSEPSTMLPRRRILSPNAISRVETSDSELSDIESDHGVNVKGKKNKPKPKTVAIQPARRKSNPLLNKDILAQVENKNANPKKTVGKNAQTKKPVKNKTAKIANKENINDESAEEQNLTMAGIEKVTEWLGRQTQEFDDEEVEKDNNSLQSSNPGPSTKPNSSILGPSKPGRFILGPSKPDPSKNGSSKPGPCKPDHSKPDPSKPGPSKPGPSKPGLTGSSKPVTSKTAPCKSFPSKTFPSKTVPTKTAPSKTVPSKTAPSKNVPSKTATAISSESPKSTAPIRPTLGTRPGPVSGRTINLIAKSIQLTKPPTKLMNDEEIAAFLDPLKTPTRKKN